MDSEENDESLALQDVSQIYGIDTFDGKFYIILEIREVTTLHIGPPSFCLERPFAFEGIIYLISLRPFCFEPSNCQGKNWMVYVLKTDYFLS